ncbi:disintegrin and metalloproteinase domain-containing protein 10 [Caerostris extrusa]|uniref:Disintegrin and metalloproteinase domain-containing protein 10 n=1 Tax=Caerostris extrusa TaxID=172846 RepID=A0AAV4UBI7_CAEEX|nr:disintegrin and metalloproteinase domain-containing protein 10 [Caerostris extrusa]
MIVSFNSHPVIVGILSFAVLASCLQIQSARILNEFILHFEPVFFDQDILNDQHRRSVRSPMDRYFLFSLQLSKGFSV